MRSPTRESRWLLWLLLISLLPNSGEVVAQRPSIATRTTLQERGCADCLDFQPLLRLGDAGESLIAATDVLARTEEGEIILAQEYDPRPLVFSQRGELVRAVGREGQGPKEFLYIMDLVAMSGGRVMALDRGNMRASIISRSDSLLATIRLPGSPRPAGTVVFPDDSLIVLASHIRTPELVGYPIHVIDWSGRHRHAIDEQPGEPWAPWLEPTLVRTLTRGDGATFWAAHLNAYEIDQWSTEGELLRSYRREVPWFDAWIRRPLLSPDGGRVSQVMDICYESGEQRLWVLLNVPSDDPDWAEGLESELGRDGRTHYGPRNLDLLYDAVIEVIDTSSDEVSASVRVDPALRRLLSCEPETIGSSFVPPDSYGIEHIDIWKITHRE